jgi:hypothetical protein
LLPAQQHHLLLLSNDPCLELCPYYKFNFLHNPKRKKSSGMKPRFLVGHRIEPHLSVCLSSRKLCTKNFSSISWEVWWCSIMLEDYIESVWVEECKGITFSMMPFVQLETTQCIFESVKHIRGMLFMS